MTKESAVRLFSSGPNLLLYVVVCNRAGWDKNQTDFKRKADCKQSNVKRLEPTHLSTGPVDNNELDTPKQLEVKR